MHLQNWCALKDSHNVQVRTLCDVDERRIQSARDLPAGIPMFRDFREMLDELDATLDAARGAFDAIA